MEIERILSLLTSLNFSVEFRVFFAIYFLRCVIVARAEQRINLRFKAFMEPFLHSRQTLTWD